MNYVGLWLLGTLIISLVLACMVHISSAIDRFWSFFGFFLMFGAALAAGCGAIFGMTYGAYLVGQGAMEAIHYVLAAG